MARQRGNGWRDDRTIEEVEGIHISRRRQDDGIKARSNVNKKPYRTKDQKEQAKWHARKDKDGTWRTTASYEQRTV